MTQEIDLQDEPYQGWQQSLEQAISQPEEPILVYQFESSWSSASRPALVWGSDRRHYVLKGQQAGRQIVNDQIVARLGQAMGAPVAEPRILEIDPELLAEEPDFQYLTPGTAHGVVFIPNCSDRNWFPCPTEHQNRERFAQLAVLYGWISASDHQFIYHLTSPNLVFSVDHGHFFPDGPNWMIESLRNAPPPLIDRKISQAVQLTDKEKSQALDTLAAVTEAEIIDAIASPPPEWGITIIERVELTNYLINRKQQLLSGTLST